MRYELMHREIPAVTLEISSEDGKTYVERVSSVTAFEHLPIGTISPGSSKINPRRIENWLNERAIPKERSGLKRIIDFAGLPHPDRILLDSLGLSLSDQYWLRPAGSGIAWHDMNFFHNEFSADLGDVLLGEIDDAKGRMFVSPDASSTGMLPKRWIIREGKRLLMKGGKAPFFQEPENEVIASYAMESLGIRHVNYELTAVRGKPYSLCETFVDDKTDFVSAYYIADRCSDMPEDCRKRYDFLIGWCEKRGISGAMEALDRIIVIDFILFNTDRHFNNFGALRDADTLGWKGFSPIFDTGNCLWNDKATKDISPQEIGECKPFSEDFPKQLLCVSDFSWIDLQRLKDLPDEIAGIFRDGGRLSPKRVERIYSCLLWRVEFLENVIHERESIREKPGVRPGPRT
ncbi:MAG: excisionase [Deltaproteobacteria bacterium]|jgi:hypothetical protein|nr:excisionase [Deltaproteobacteria bacterium]